jgi:predicted transcriptional regulator
MTHNPGYTFGMKTAISIPDDVFADAERLARELNQSRSQLYSRAVREYVARHSADSVTAALDAVCGEDAAADAGFAARAARRSFERTEW